MSKDKSVQPQDSNANQGFSKSPTELAKEPAQAAPATPAAEEKQPEPAVEPQKPREVHMMPVHKATEDKQRAVEKARQEAEAEWQTKLDNEKAEWETKFASLTPSNYDEELQKVADEHNMDFAAAKAFMGVMQKTVKVPDVSKVENLLREQQLNSQKLQASNDFDSQVVEFIKRDHPDASPEQVAEAKKKCLDLAFTEKYHALSMAEIYKLNDFDFKHGYTGEGSGRKASDYAEFDNVSAEDEANMTPEQYKKYSTYMAQKGSRYTDVK